MMYSAFAAFYDELTGNISYGQRAKYFDSIIKKFHTSGPILLDLACGTGSLSVELSRLGYDVIGVDHSADMLSVALEKKLESGQDILFLCQDMTELDLYGTVDTTVCALDSINHVTDPEKVKKIFQGVSLFTAPGGLFIFDVNSPYKHRRILGNNTFVYDCDSVYCVWQNEYEEDTQTVSISLDFFAYEEESDSYRRSGEQFQERSYEPCWLEQLLEDSGFELLAVYADDSLEEPKEDSQRLIYVARKPMLQENQ